MKTLIISIDLIGLVSQSYSALISLNSVVANSAFNPLYVAENTINGSGLPASDAHVDYAANNHWTIADSTPPTDTNIT